ncbi:MAG: HAD-IC family P-type ATPase, partial [Blautia sp.]|nr:HAD-IC family P-type ATPase [Blautia sp.]
MRCTILHETTGRMRVGLRLRTLSMEQADTLEAYLRSFSFVRLAKVDERTCHALIRFTPGERAAVIGALSSFDFSSKDLPEVAHSSRAISRHYQDKMIFHVVRRFLIRRLLPFPVRQVLTTLKAIPYLKRGLASLSQKKLGVSVLDAASITVSLLRREFDTAGSIMFLLQVGDIMEEWTHKKSVEDLAGVMALNVDKVWIRTPQGQEVLLPLSRVKTGDVGLVRAGNMIPLDGEVIEGEATVNQASLTGEALPVPKRCGSTIYAGTVVEEGEISFRVKEAAGESRYERIITMIEDSEKLKSVSEAKASRLADRLVPWTFLASGATFLLTRSAARATSILMVDFCCALKLSMPIAVLSAMREAGERQIIAKGGKFLEKMAEADTIVFDKTGTLTEAVPTVKDIVPFGGNDPQEILRLAACLEEHFPHSIANAV